MSTLTEQDFQKAAAELGCEVAVIKAVAQVEAPDGGFLPTGEPTMLFERHLFSKYTNGRYDKSNPDISNRIPGGYGTKASQPARLAKAAKLDRAAALRATSWGKFQILGNNYIQAGFTQLQDFVNAMYRSEADQLEAFVNFIKNDRRLLNAVRTRNFPMFAELYNGPNYRINNYDTKLTDAYQEYA